ncbi:hypothetical protein RFI_12390 [Reticulomyxa filosa]|uniref:Uncharacterized protein n=1 Tax=Reticulomyxa filosa TaxID=46433 RepID=X6NHD4_RETFI|nr:hypothetical protein RFI_12390 [Reticulomyxa filosa]|eukprot:ETO24767.1 hypothetical protein RFI_12390 [Reticulomyxa filosa]
MLEHDIRKKRYIEWLDEWRSCASDLYQRAFRPQEYYCDVHQPDTPMTDAANDTLPETASNNSNPKKRRYEDMLKSDVIVSENKHPNSTAFGNDKSQNWIEMSRKQRQHLPLQSIINDTLLTQQFQYITYMYITEISKIFDDTDEKYANTELLVEVMTEWQSRYRKDYETAYGSTCLIKIVAHYIKKEMMEWYPLSHYNSFQHDHIGPDLFVHHNWYRLLSSISYCQEIIPTLVAKVVVPHCSDIIAFDWNVRHEEASQTVLAILDCIFDHIREENTTNDIVKKEFEDMWHTHIVETIQKKFTELIDIYTFNISKNDWDLHPQMYCGDEKYEYLFNVRVLDVLHLLKCLQLFVKFVGEEYWRQQCKQIFTKVIEPFLAMVIILIEQYRNQSFDLELQLLHDYVFVVTNTINSTKEVVETETHNTSVTADNVKKFNEQIKSKISESQVFQSELGQSLLKQI